MGLKQDLEAARDTVGVVLHNANTALTERGVPPMGTLAALPDALDAVHECGVSDGKQAAYDAFWDAYQEKGYRRTYQNAFSGYGWNADTFKPKYDIVVVGSAQNLFANIGISDVRQRLKDLNIVLNTAEASNFSYAFAGAHIKYLPTISTLSADTLAYMFYGSYALRSIPLLILREDGSQVFTSAFYQCSKLEELCVTGKIGNSINLKWSPLSRASIESVMAALSDTVTGKTVTFKKTAVDAAFTAAEWAALTATKPNWTVGVV